MKAGRVAREKGAWAEREVVRVLNQSGLKADRAYGEGRRDDRGDILGLPGWYVQVRCRHTLRMHGWWRSTQRRANALDLAPVLVAGLFGLSAETWIVWDVAGRYRLQDWAKLPIHA